MRMNQNSSFSRTKIFTSAFEVAPPGQSTNATSLKQRLLRDQIMFGGIRRPFIIANDSSHFGEIRREGRAWRGQVDRLLARPVDSGGLLEIER